MIAMDFMGLGLSTDQGNSTSMDQLAQDVDNLARENKIEQSVVMGVSLGGIVAIQYALQYPEQVKALILSGNPHNTQNRELQQVIDDKVKGFLEDDPKSYYENHVEEIFSAGFVNSKIGKYYADVFKESFTNDKARTGARIWDSFKTLNLDISKIKCPTLVIAGEKDSAYHYSQIISKGVQDGQFESVTDAGHAVCLEDPINYNMAVARFLKQIEY